MSEYTIASEGAITTVAAGDLVGVTRTSDGSLVKATAAKLLGGNSTSGKLAFYGNTWVVQPVATNQAAAASTAATNAGQWGFTTSTQANAIVTLVNQLRSDLVTLGLIKGSN